MSAHPQLSFDELTTIEETPLHEVTFVVVDLETTGGDRTADAVTEIGAVKVRGGEVLAMFLAACGLCLVSELLARRMKTPVTTFLICALIPLVPGGGMYYTMLAIIQGNTMSALETGIHTLGCAGALALGIALTSAFFSFSMKKS